MSSWNFKVRKLIKKMKQDDLADFDIDYIDLDKLIELYV